MSRLSIELTQEQHQKIKAMAALTGTSIREYVVSRLFPASSNEELDLKELEMLLDKRIESAKAGQVSRRTVGEIFKEVYKETQP
ncbi:MAG: antitoxin [Nitrospiraceae bacterium]|nr:antitoxin [Nitrospiraceae bacterium]